MSNSPVSEKQSKLEADLDRYLTGLQELNEGNNTEVFKLDEQVYSRFKAKNLAIVKELLKLDRLAFEAATSTTNRSASPISQGSQRAQPSIGFGAGYQANNSGGQMGLLPQHRLSAAPQTTGDINNAFSGSGASISATRPRNSILGDQEPTENTAHTCDCTRLMAYYAPHKGTTPSAHRKQSREPTCSCQACSQENGKDQRSFHNAVTLVLACTHPGCRKAIKLDHQTDKRFVVDPIFQKMKPRAFSKVDFIRENQEIINQIASNKPKSFTKTFFDAETTPKHSRMSSNTLTSRSKREASFWGADLTENEVEAHKVQLGEYIAFLDQL